MPWVAVIRRKRTVSRPYRTIKLQKDSVFSRFLTLFSGATPRPLRGETTSAISDGRLYCFIDPVQGLSDRYERASVVNVGAGSIQVGNRLSHQVYDGDLEVERALGNSYQTRQVTRLDRSIPDLLCEDTTSPDLRVEVIVDDCVHLAFSYRLSSSRGTIIISPGKFVTVSLSRAASFKAGVYCPGKPIWQGHASTCLDNLRKLRGKTWKNSLWRRCLARKAF